MQREIITDQEIVQAVGVLSELDKRLILVGGSAVTFYAEDPAAGTPRPTEDIDLVTSVGGYVGWAKIQDDLRRLGISSDEERSLCSFLLGNIKLDIMPIEDTEIGPTNRWYGIAADFAVKIEHKGIELHLLPAPFFIATKFEAFDDRGEDIRTSPDIEDIFYIVDSRPSLPKDVLNADDRVRDFLAQRFREIRRDQHCEEIITAHLEQEDRYEIVVSRIDAILDGVSTRS